MIYYLIAGNRVVTEIERSAGDVTALPLLDQARIVSLVNRNHLVALATRMSWTEEQVLENLGLVDARQQTMEP